MKKFILMSGVLLISIVSSYAQRIGYLDLETIVKEVPEYVAAQDYLTKLSEQYSDEIEVDYVKVEQQFNDYQKVKNTLTSTQREARENAIINAERAIQEKQKRYFGEEGLMNQRSKELMDPIVTKIQGIIDTFAERNGYSMIIDTSALSGVIYKNRKDDLSNEIIKILKK